MANTPKETKKSSRPVARSTSMDRAKVARVLIAAEHHVRRVSKRRAGAAARRVYNEAAGLIHTLASRTKPAKAARA